MLQSERSKWQKIKSLLSIIDIARMKKKSDVSDFIFWNDQYCIILDRITYIATESGRDILANFVKIYRFEFQVETWRSLDENARDITQGRSASAEDRSTSVHVSSSIWRHLPVNLYELFASHLSLIINPMIERTSGTCRYTRTLVNVVRQLLRVQILRNALETVYAFVKVIVDDVHSAES